MFPTTFNNLRYHCTFQDDYQGIEAGSVQASLNTSPPQGIRHIENLCDSDCPCFEGQGMEEVLFDIYGSLSDMT